MLTAQRVLFSLVAAFWLIAGALATLGVLDFGLRSGARVLGLLMLGNAAALALGGWLSVRGYRLVDYASLAVVAVNALLSVTDEIGALDIASLLVNAGLFALLVINLRAQRP
jgi:hypothetical protein